MSSVAYYLSNFMNRNIIISPEAEEDIEEVFNYIVYKVMAPETAVRYYMGIYDTIQNLSVIGAVLPKSQQPLLRTHYGKSVRTVCYKKMTIVYNIIENVVYVRRVLASSLIR